jgi:pilus assembly protein CpaE
MATALASLFAREHNLTTALVDLDAQFGSVALGLDLEPSRGLRDALEKPDRIDSLFLERVMMKASDRLSILSAEEPLGEQIHLHAHAGELLLAGLREKFPMIVLDLPRQFTPLTRYALAEADQVVIVTEPGILPLRDALRLRDLLVDQLKRPAPLYIVNREGLAGKHEVPRAEFAKHLGAPVALHVPFNAEIIALTARGDTLLEDAKLADGLRKLAQQLSGGEAAATTKKTGGLAGLLKGRK